MTQSVMCNNHHLANYWIHNGMLETEGGKMSKSLGNTQWAKDVIAENGANLTRWLLLSAKYRDTLIYSDETYEASKVELTKIETILRQVEVKKQLDNVEFTQDYDEKQYQQFLDAMANDLNTPNGYKVIFDTVKLLNQSLRVREIDYSKVEKLYNAIKKMLYILGIYIDEVILTDEDKEIYDKWNEAKSKKDFETADKFRAILMERNIL